MTTLYQRDLRRKMISSFDTGELRTLAFDLSINWDELRGEVASEKATAMVSHQMRKGELEALIDLLKEERPNVDWPRDIPDPEQQIEDEKADLSEAERKAIFDNLLSKIGPLVSSVAQIKAQVEADLKYLDAPRTGHLVRLLAGANLIGHINLEGVSLTKEDLDEANLRFALLRHANLDAAFLRRSNMRYAELFESNLEGAKLEGANLEGANLIFTNLGGADLTEANLEAADCRRSLMVGARLSKARLIMSNLEGADLRGALLSGADLRRANLRGANLRRAELLYAYLTEANMEAAHLEGAHLNNAEMYGAILHGANYTADTVWPEGFDPKAAGAILVNDRGKPVKKSK